MRSVLLCLVLAMPVLSLGAGCGGSTQGTEAKAPGDQSETSDSEPSTGSAEDAEQESADSAQPKGLGCDDGSCSPCGAGMCLAGWYCDEGATGGPACSWLKECTEKPSCSCITRVLGSSCQCREESGGLRVSCS